MKYIPAKPVIVRPASAQPGESEYYYDYGGYDLYDCYNVYEGGETGF